MSVILLPLKTRVKSGLLGVFAATEGGAGRSAAALRRSTGGFPGSSRGRLKGDFDVFSHNSTKCCARLEVNKHTGCRCKAFIEERKVRYNSRLHGSSECREQIGGFGGRGSKLRRRTPSETRHPAKRCAAPGQTPASWQGFTLVQTRLNVRDKHRQTSLNCHKKKSSPTQLLWLVHEVLRTRSNVR